MVTKKTTRKKTPVKKSSVENYLKAKDAAKWANEFAGLTSKKRKNLPPHMSKEPPKDMEKVKKYGKWAQEEAKKAHEAKNAALKTARRPKATSKRSKVTPKRSTMDNKNNRLGNKAVKNTRSKRKR